MKLDVPPNSVVQAVLRDDPWKVLVACVLLNRTSWRVAYPALETIFDRWPDPAALAAADPTELEGVLRPLGFQRRRTATLVSLSRACDLLAVWPDDLKPGDLPGVGRYAVDSYRIFVRGDETVVPEDKRLRAYLRDRLTVGSSDENPSPRES